MTDVSLSTMWSLNYQNMADFINDTRQFGFTHIEFNCAVTAERAKDILAVADLPVSSIHAPCPDFLTGEGANASTLSLGSLNEDERREAVAATRTTIELAVQVGAKVVVVHAGGVEMNPEMEKALRRLHTQGLMGGEEFADIKRKLMAGREFFVCPHLDATNESLLDLAGYARERGVRLALENRVNYHEIPLIDEMLDILGQFDPEVVGYWHDVGHADIQSRTGFTPHEEWLMALADRMIGVHLHDVRGVQDHYAPGAGDLDWDLISQNLPPDVIRVCEIGQWNDPEDARRAVPFLRSKGII